MMAADLTLLRSRLLVPADATAAQEAQDEAERLRQHLLAGGDRPGRGLAGGSGPVGS